jgi:hypothetical protein
VRRRNRDRARSGGWVLCLLRKPGKAPGDVSKRHNPGSVNAQINCWESW